MRSFLLASALAAGLAAGLVAAAPGGPGSIAPVLRLQSLHGVSIGMERASALAALAVDGFTELDDNPILLDEDVGMAVAFRLEALVRVSDDANVILATEAAADGRVLLVSSSRTASETATPTSAWAALTLAAGVSDTHCIRAVPGKTEIFLWADAEWREARPADPTEACPDRSVPGAARYGIEKVLTRARETTAIFDADFTRRSGWFEEAVGGMPAR